MEQKYVIPGKRLARRSALPGFGGGPALKNR
jgi:hypothetical protein